MMEEKTKIGENKCDNYEFNELKEMRDNLLENELIHDDQEIQEDNRKSN